MKKVMLVGVMFTMFMGVASAASINGDYKGSPIVKIYSQGIEIKSNDIPPMIYNGRTVVPMSLLTKLGISLDWNQKEYKLRVFMPEVGTAQTTETINSKNFNTIQTLKIYSKIQNNFYKIETLGENLKDITQVLSMGFNSIGKVSETETFELLDKTIEANINQIEDVVAVTTDVVDLAIKNNIDIIVMKDILTSYLDSFDLLMSARDSLKDYSIYNKTSDFNSYLSNYSTAYDNLSKAMTKANAGYNEYLGYVQY